MSEPLSYPLSENHPDRLRTPSGLRYQDLTLEALLEGRAGMEELRVTAEALRMQAEIARAAGRRQLAENLERAAELTQVPDEEILEIYEALRPGRATRDQLEQLAARLERDYGALRTAALIREAAEAAPASRANPD